MEAFLIAEYNALQARALEFERIKSSRINFFLLVIGASIAGFSGISNMADLFGIPGYKPDYMMIAIFLIAIDLLLGILTYRFSLNQSMAVITFHRRAARIRRYFLDLDWSKNKYFPFAASDQVPKYNLGKRAIMWRGGEPILILINALLSSLILFLAMAGRIPIILSLLLVVGMFLVVSYLQLEYASSLLKVRDTSANTKAGRIAFPIEAYKDLEQKYSQQSVENSGENEPTDS